MKSVSFSKKSQSTPESPIAYYMEQAIENPHLISLAAGLVDNDSLPVELVKESIDRIFSNRKLAKMALQYGTTQGFLDLREEVLKHVLQLDQNGINGISETGKIGKNELNSRNVVVSSGSQQILYLLCEILLDPEDIVITEIPSYFVFHSALLGHQVQFKGIPMDEEGMQITVLEEYLSAMAAAGQLHRIKLIYTVDYFQNPSGLTLSKNRREQLFRVVQKFADQQRILILEDAAYRELRYEGEDIPSIKSLDQKNEHVIYAGTFSKPTAPGFKTGYSIMPADLIPAITRIKANHDFGSNNLSQHILFDILKSGAYARHVQNLLPVYRKKRDTMLQVLSECFGDLSEVSWTKPKGGMFIWITFSPRIETGGGSEFLKEAIRQGVLYVPGECGLIGESRKAMSHHARLAFGEPTIEEIQKGIHRLRKAYDTVMKK